MLPVATANAAPAPAIASFVLFTPNGVPVAAVMIPLHCQFPKTNPSADFGPGRFHTYDAVNRCVRSKSAEPRAIRQLKGFCTFALVTCAFFESSSSACAHV